MDLNEYDHAIMRTLPPYAHIRDIVENQPSTRNLAQSRSRVQNSSDETVGLDKMIAQITIFEQHEPELIKKPKTDFAVAEDALYGLAEALNQLD